MRLGLEARKPALRLSTTRSIRKARRRQVDTSERGTRSVLWGSIETSGRRGFDAARLDIALLPNWMVDGADERRLISRHIKPRQIVAIYLAPGVTPRVHTAKVNGAPVRHFARSLERLDW